jgi:methyl-accepting chemotaxis protein
VKKSLSLSTLAAAVTAFALIVAMGLYAAFEHIRVGTSWEELLFTHAWHVIALTATVEIALVLVLRSAVSDPIRLVNKHLYGVATGHVDPLLLSSRVEEVEELVSGVNAMVKRLEMSRDEDALDHSDEDLAALAELLHQLDPNGDAVLRLSRLERALSSVPRPSTHPPKPDSLETMSVQPRVALA